jgi:hypothetical protein
MLVLWTKVISTKEYLPSGILVVHGKHRKHGIDSFFFVPYVFSVDKYFGRFIIGNHIRADNSYCPPMLSLMTDK